MSPRSKVSIGECIALRPTEEEAAIIWDAVRECGFEEDGSGVLRLLILLLSGEDESPSRHPIFQHFKENPEDLETVKAVTAQALGALLKRFRQ